MAKIVKKKKGLDSARPAFGSGGVKVTSDLRPRNTTKNPPCLLHCPNGNAIRTALTTVSQSEEYGRNLDDSYKMAWEIFTETSPFPATCGRVCPHPCEEGCNREKFDGAVGINSFERFIGDYAIQHDLQYKKSSDQVFPEKVAVVGSGPAGMSCAYHLARKGYKVTVFEAFSKPGGMLRYGIPDYRLPPDILDAEINKILELGVELKLNKSIGTDMTIDDLKKEYSAIFVGIGAHKGLKLKVEGEDAPNVFSGTDFLNRMNSGKKVDVGDNVVVVGGGDSAIDAARVSKRLGANVTILYRRTIAEMPAIKHEIDEALKEGVKLEFLAAPIAFKKENGKAVSIKCIRMELGEPDSSGRRRPVPKEGSEFDLACSTVIAAISQEPNFTGFENFIEGRDWIKVDDKFTSIKDEKVYAGGDVIDLGLVIIAIAQGRKAAEVIDTRMRTREFAEIQGIPEIKADKMLLDFYKKYPRKNITFIPVEDRLANPDKEVSVGLTSDEVIAESKRCMSCGYCFDCGNCWMYCQDTAVVKPTKKGELYTFKNDFCTGCKKCSEQCPCGFIDMV
jgi:NADPH-dependent glutamate synthase beta subunit-like oxidoreductase